jgi:tetratricopeptide (TPR) repeat protein
MSETVPETTTPCARCPICNTEAPWKNVDEYRIKPSGMSLCMTCGFVSYPDVILSTDKLKEFYREEYRDVPTVQNLYAGERKLHYHNEFLSEVFHEWASQGFITPTVCDIGAAFGLFLAWFKKQLPHAQLHGTELTLSFRRNAWHEHKFKLTEEMDTSIKYDFISSYKVAEHIPNIDKEIRKYAECLSDRGLLYISVPCWFDTLNNFGATGFSLEYYYHKNHINVWSRKLFETLLKKCGLEIIKQDHVFYDSTYLCKRNDALMSVVPVYDDPNEVLSNLDRIKKAAIAFDNSQFELATQLWPNFPDAQIGKYESKRQQYHQQGFDGLHENYLKQLLKDCPNSSVAMIFCADICMRYSKWDFAIEYLDKGLKMRPNDPGALTALAHCFRQLGNAATHPKEKTKWLEEARTATRYLKTVSIQNSHDCITWIYNDNARIPMPGEVEKVVS